MRKEPYFPLGRLNPAVGENIQDSGRLYTIRTWNIWSVARSVDPSPNNYKNSPPSIKETRMRKELCENRKHFLCRTCGKEVRSVGSGTITPVVGCTQACGGGTRCRGKTSIGNWLVKPLSRGSKDRPTRGPYTISISGCH